MCIALKVVLTSQHSSNHISISCLLRLVMLDYSGRLVQLLLTTESIQAEETRTKPKLRAV